MDSLIHSGSFLRVLLMLHAPRNFVVVVGSSLITQLSDSSMNTSANLPPSQSQNVSTNRTYYSPLGSCQSTPSTLEISYLHLPAQGSVPDLFAQIWSLQVPDPDGLGMIPGTFHLAARGQDERSSLSSLVSSDSTPLFQCSS